MTPTNDDEPKVPGSQDARSAPDDERAGPPIPSLLRNWLSLAGFALVALALAYTLFALLVTLLGVEPNPYFGLLVYLLFPSIAFLGLLLVPIGILFERRRRRKLVPGEIPAYPRIDLNSPSARRRALIVAGFSSLFLTLTIVATYRAYHFTDSVSFCGQVCHTPMKPEFTAYLDSPHARVSCDSCHVGPGASWYVRSKFSGVYQVYAVLASAYPKPIATPIRALRPVREACERCHWPEKFYGAQLKVFTHFASDEKNTPLQIQMLINTGGGSAEHGRATGIHWHMAISNKVWFVATDKQQQTIPWVRMETEDGRVTEYFSKGDPLDPKQIAEMPKQIVECVSCHSRPSHKFRPPDQAVDEALAAAQLDSKLPFVKQQAVKVLAASYPSTEAAIEGIATGLDDFYHARYAALYVQEQPQIKQAIATVQSIYRNNVFPDMKADWRTHPDNIGHLYYPGCFRCHDGQHVSADGRVIPTGCDTCHAFLRKNPTSQTIDAKHGEPFDHPVDLSTLAGTPCSDCHNGAGG
jgi:nitrate/TMAO reductase-like tetraheme cytochrome c subunit